jgi:hypothetical protein
VDQAATLSAIAIQKTSPPQVAASAIQATASPKPGDIMSTKYVFDLSHAAYYQDNALLCWAAVGLTVYRLKHKNVNDLDTFLGRLGGEQARAIYELTGWVIQEQAQHQLTLPAAMEAARVSNDEHPFDPPDRFAETAVGLPFSASRQFFGEYLQMKAIDGDDESLSDRTALKKLLKAHSPLVVITQNTSGQGGHVRLLHGYDDVNYTDENKPLISIWDPEAKLKGKRAFSSLTWSEYIENVFDRLAAPVFHRW